jgi:hypothetical protein
MIGQAFMKLTREGRASQPLKAAISARPLWLTEIPYAWRSPSKRVFGQHNQVKVIFLHTGTTPAMPRSRPYVMVIGKKVAH